MEHIAEHYERHHFDVAQWSPSLMIPGLLKQRDFNLFAAWKDIAPSNAGLLQWSTKDVQILKRRLEFQEGSPQELASLALSLATDGHTTTSQEWIAPDVFGSSSSLPAMSLSQSGEIWPGPSASDQTQSASFSDMLAQVDFDMQVSTP